jgi:hypothetical protein
VRYLALAFAGEGPTDHNFIAPLVTRHTEALIVERSDEVVQIGPVVSVLPEGRASNQADLVAHEFLTGAMYADLLFIHTDGGSNIQRAHDERVDPVQQALAGLDSPPRVIGVVPARETEAWMLADPSALERVLGVRGGVIATPEPPSRVHRLEDPKAVLRALVDDLENAHSRRARSRRHAAQLSRLYSGLAMEVGIDVMRRVPSFRRYEADLVQQLVEIGLVNG